MSEVRAHYPILLQYEHLAETMDGRIDKRTRVKSLSSEIRVFNFYQILLLSRNFVKKRTKFCDSVTETIFRKFSLNFV